MKKATLSIFALVALVSCNVDPMKDYDADTKVEIITPEEGEKYHLRPVLK